ncbi:hypothetical protein EIP91_011750 [Steccherinum ochraceum]|uniref:Linoleate diol synthase n=1 Tax=Steccherinum ochraceum TaxID=92696 RepID=A0A4R0RR92_9APHY|nr:hypothetical protein EIP91_011750 [Steccherinum ochraceum]
MSFLRQMPAEFMQRTSSFTSNNEKQRDSTISTSSNESHFKTLTNFRNQIKSGIPFFPDLSTLSGIVDALRHSNAIDDRKLLLEHILTFLANLPKGDLETKLQNAVIELLYNDLPHPPVTYLGEKYAFRAADGSNNSLMDPDMGKAGAPYARTVQQGNPLPSNQMPDPGLVFDTLLKRDKFVDHPAGISSMLFAFGTLVVHTIFRTSHRDFNVNETSSYIDLSILYGDNQESQDKVRMHDGRGCLRPDIFAEDRVLLLPPACAALLVLFNRNHNYIAKRLLEINERGTYKDVKQLSDDDRRTQDNDIFQTTRLINSTWFLSTIFSDYLSSILGFVRSGNSWCLDPFGEIRQTDHTLCERGRGNACSVEFNCIYRWHASVSQEDEKWFSELFGQYFPGKRPEDVTVEEFMIAARKGHASNPDLTQWTIGQVKRQADGTFKDEDLARIIQDAISSPAGAFRARGIPSNMRLLEIMGIEQARTWGVGSLNDLRKFLGLKAHESFLEWNSDPEIARMAQKLYGDINRLELYVGLQAEEAKPVTDGTGLCPPYTISRAILSDAVALVRGDRFYTTDFTPYNLTSWGFQDCQRDPNSPGFGNILGRLFLRTLPDNFTYNSVYTWFPFMTPASMSGFLGELGDADKFNFMRPTAKKGISVPDVDDYKSVREVLSNPERFRVYTAARAGTIISGPGFFIAPEDASIGERERLALVKVLTSGTSGVASIVDYFYKKTQELIKEESWTSVGSQGMHTKNVDITRDVLKFVPMYWACEVIGIPLKKNSEDVGFGTPVQEMWDMLTNIYSYLFLDIDESKHMNMREKAKKDIQTLLDCISDSSGIGLSLSFTGVLSTMSHIFTIPNMHDEFISRFIKLGYDSNKMANTLLAFLVGTTVEMSQGLTHLVNFYLGENRMIRTYAGKAVLSSKEEAAMQSLVSEGLRLDPSFRGVYRAANGLQTFDGMKVKGGEPIFVNIAKANMDPQEFNNPQDVNLTRAPQNYLFDDGCQRCLGSDLATKIMAHVLRAVFGCRNMRRAPGQSGRLKRIPSDMMRTSTYVYLVDDDKLTPWATSMVVQYDAN